MDFIVIPFNPSIILSQAMGVTHTSCSSKTKVSFNVVFMEEETAVPFLVDVVKQNDATASLFYHSVFVLEAKFAESSGKGKSKSAKSRSRRNCKMTKGKKKRFDVDDGGRLLRNYV
jgi:hypothetical protein